MQRTGKIKWDWRRPSVLFGRGKALPKIIRYGREYYGMTSGVNTNGTKLTPALLQMLSEAGVDNNVVSLDGASKEFNDYICGSGTFSLL